MVKWGDVDRSDVNGCWLWPGTKDPYGYGRIREGGRYVATHRKAYAEASGPIPNGMLVCHTCDNRICCNPSHLWLGTVAENNADAKAKGRTCIGDMNGMRKVVGIFKGERHPQAKLTDAQREQIIRLRSDGISYSELGRRFGVSRTTAKWISKRTHSRAAK